MTEAIVETNQVIEWAGQVTSWVTNLSFAASELIDAGSTVGFAEFKADLDDAAEALGIIADVGNVAAELQTDLNKAQDSRDTWTAYFNASIDLLADARKAETAALVGESVGAFVEGLSIGLGATFAAPVVVPIAGLFATAAFTIAFDKVWTTEAKPFLTQLYQDHFAPPPTTKHITGKAADGVLAGATVFVDSNYDGRLDNGEVSTTTDQNGNYSLDAGIGQIVVIGGHDVSSGQPFPGTMVLHDGQTIISPLTTLINIRRDDGDLSANVTIARAFNLPTTLDLQTYDSVSGMALANVGAAPVYVAGAEVAITVDILASLFAGIAPARDLLHDAYDVLAFTSGLLPGSAGHGTPGHGFALDIVGTATASTFGTLTLITTLEEAEGHFLNEQTVNAAAAQIASLNSQIEGALNTYLTAFGGVLPAGSAALNLINAQLFAAVGAAEQIAQKAAAVLDFGTNPTDDFNDDTQSDILIRNDDGRMSIWEMNGVSIMKGASTNTPTLDPTWHNVDTADFNDDGKADILLRNDDGRVSVWEMDGFNLIEGKSINTGNALDPSWHIAGTGDFNADAHGDILLRNDDGRTSIWEMNGFSIIHATTINGAPLLDPSWHIAGTGDFNNDGKSDIVLRNDDGRLSIWQIDGTAFVKGVAINTDNPLDPSWHNAGTGDFNGDGFSDILLRNDDGRVSIWEMNGFTILKGAVAQTPLLDPSWHISGTDDFNGDLNSDILLRNDDGRVSVWEMSGLSLIKGVTVNSGSSLDPTWHVENHQHDLA